MRLSALLAALPEELAPLRVESGSDADPVIRGLCYDSRAASPGDLFFALCGADVDGHEYLPQAIARGSAAVVVQTLPDAAALKGRTAVLVPDSRRALAPLARRFFGDPASELEMIGVTGTNGKTSVSYLIESILREAGRRVGLIGTVEIRFANERQRALNTTPESLDLQRTLRAMVGRDIQSVVMEVSSHGLELGRVAGCRFDVACFTNLTQDHLDFHAGMDGYRASKRLLFERHLRDGAAAVINVDDDAAPDFVAAASAAGAKLVRVSRDAGRDAEVRLLDADVQLTGTRARIDTPHGPLELEIPLVGDFNVENTLVACGAAFALGHEPDVVAAGVARCPQVPGRAERISSGASGEPTVVVDYAHTPDAVEKLLRTLRPLTAGRLITVFGCGGDRDRAKRPLMAEAVVRFSDRIVATSDNPRTEDPTSILADVERGLSARKRVVPEALDATPHAYCVIEDRRAAIDTAVGIAQPGDMVVLAGKGHEDYQIIGRERLPFSDCDEARRALAERSAR